MCSRQYLLCFFLLLSVVCHYNTAQGHIVILNRLNTAERLSIAHRIWLNESQGQITGLSHWNPGERFASMGIGHFTWYPAPHRYHGTFAQLLQYFQKHNVILPAWLRAQPQPACPWPNRRVFYQDINSPMMRDLRAFLLDHINLQVAFMIERLEHALQRMLQDLPVAQQQQLNTHFWQLANTNDGLYALIDYVNFKGEGLKHPPHRHGWGLKQVLLMMQHAPASYSPLQQFIWSADEILTRRVLEAPRNEHTERWLKGWRRRIYRYTE
jgi:hypothetical protein